AHAVARDATAPAPLRASTSQSRSAATRGSSSPSGRQTTALGGSGFLAARRRLAEPAASGFVHAGGHCTCARSELRSGTIARPACRKSGRRVPSSFLRARSPASPCTYCDTAFPASRGLSFAFFGLVAPASQSDCASSARDRAVARLFASFDWKLPRPLSP